MSRLERYLAIAVCVVAFGFVACAQNGPVTCLAYEPAVVELAGTLVLETSPAHPNGSGMPGSNSPETYWTLELPRPVCVDADKMDRCFNPAHNNVRAIQLLVDNNSLPAQHGNSGTKVVVSGTLLGAHNANHHTPVLLRVTSVALDSDSAR